MAPTLAAPDAALGCLLRLGEGRDAAAWGMLLELVGPAIHRLASRLTGDPTLADDAVQETLLRVRDAAVGFRAAPGDDDRAARRWILAIAAHVSLNLVRQRRRARLRDRRAAADAMAAAESPERALERSEIDDAIRLGLAELPESKRAPIALRVVAGLSYDDVAAQLRVPVGTAKARVHRGLEDLRRRLTRAGFALSLVGVSGGLTELPASAGAFDAGSCAQLLHAKVAAASATTLAGTAAIAAVVVAGSALALGCVSWFRGAHAAAPPAVAATAAGAPPTMPSVGQAKPASVAGEPPYFYVYELHPPSLRLTAGDRTIGVQVGIEAMSASDSDRRSSSAQKVWLRSTDHLARNEAQQLGVRIELAVGRGPFKPITIPGALGDGFVPLEVLRASQGKLECPAEAIGLRHAFRAREVVKATGFTGDAESDHDNRVLVHDGPFAEPQDWRAELGEAYERDHGFLARFVRGERVAPTGTELAANQLVYVSSWSDPAAIVADSDLRYAFQKVTVDLEDPTKEVAVFLVTRRFHRTDGSEVWLEQPVQFKTAVGAVVGGRYETVVPGMAMKRELDLTTPYRLAEIRRDVDRIWYYELEVTPRLDSGPGASHDKDLQVDAHTKKTDVAMLVDDASGQTLAVPKLADVRGPTRQGTIAFPVYPTAVHEEEREFSMNPAAFRQAGLMPPEPVRHAPGTGPLQELREKTGDPLFATDTAYFEMPDGRLYWWDPVDHKLMRDPAGP